jgi:hypothetical protein
MKPKPLRIESLRNLYGSDRCLHALLNNAVRPKTLLAGRESVIEELQNVLTLEGVSGVRRRELVQSLRRMDQADVGKFFLGRRGRPSRFAWSQQPREIALKILPPPAEAKPPTVAGIQEEGGMCIYPFRLRRQLIVFLKLPQDLSLNEATRLGTFLQSLPLEGAG